MTRRQEASNGSSSEARTRPVQGLLLLLCLIVAWLVASGPVGHTLDNNVSDVFVRWLPDRPAEPSISTLIAIDEETLSLHGGMRALRPIVAQILEQLATSPPKVVAIDLTLADKGDSVEDARLAKAMGALPGVVLAAEIRSTGREWELPAPAFAAAVSATGHVHAAPDSMDSVCRAIPLEKAVDRQRYWALSLEAYRLWRSEPYVLETPESLVVGSVEIPSSRQEGRLLRIRFLPPGSDGVSGVRRISAAEFLAAPERFPVSPDGVYFVGVTAPSAARDRLMTPFSYGRTMQGVEIHANAFETLARRHFYYRVQALVGFALSLLLSGAVGLAFLFFSGWRTYAFAAVPLALSMGVPFAGQELSLLAPTTLLVLSTCLPFLVLSAHRYWFVDRKLQRAEKETENYRDAIHYVTHEMRTPLTAIQGSSELISRYPLSPEKQKQIAGMIHSESKRLGRLIQVFLDVERLSAGQMQLREDAIPMAGLVAVCVERAQALAENKEITILVDAACDAQLDLQGDRELLEHALYNLITNAIKYSPSGTTVRVGCRKLATEGVLSVTDEGIGMTAEEQKAVFRKFYRTAAAEKSGEKGSGIGLSIVEQIVSAHGGRIEVQSEPGRGSCFSMVVPLRNSALSTP